MGYDNGDSPKAHLPTTTWPHASRAQELHTGANMIAPPMRTDQQMRSARRNPRSDKMSIGNSCALFKPKAHAENTGGKSLRIFPLRRKESAHLSTAFRRFYGLGLNSARS